MTGFTHVLHPTDFSEASQVACEKAVDLAHQCGAKLTVLHVYANPLMAEGFAYVPDLRPELEEKLGEVANEEIPIAVARELQRVASGDGHNLGDVIAEFTISCRCRTMSPSMR